MSSERNLSANTLAAYARDLKKFEQFQIKLNRKMLESTRTQIEDFLKQEFDQGLNAATRARRLSSIKQFFKFILDENIREDNPAIKIRPYPKLSLFFKL